MVIPDYDLITEISLYSIGFKNADILAKKIISIYKFCSEILSNQKEKRSTSLLRPDYSL